MKTSHAVTGVFAAVAIVGTAALSIIGSGDQDCPHCLPDPKITPGALDPALTDDVLRSPGFTTKTYRNVPEAEKNEVYVRYGMKPDEAPCPCEVDHYISLEIGGSNDLSNLWPEPFSIDWNGYDVGAHTKDRLEDVLGKMVKEGKISGADARAAIQQDWREAYKKYVSPTFPAYTGK